ncbi:MAG: hypothetical protein ACKO96_36150, partial [Flammeovirgaceae bacterium]
MCDPCGTHIQIPQKLVENVVKMKNQTDTLWIYCDEHKDQIAGYYWHKDKMLACMDCYVKNEWDTKNLQKIPSESVDEYFQRLLEKLF